MKFTVRIALAGLGLAWAASAQNLPPGILLLSRVKAHIREELARLPNCSCLETVHREYQPAGGKLRPLDTIRLEVLYSDHRELYASPGDRRFAENHPIDFAGSGTIGNGYFALYLSEIASEGRLSYEYKGEDTIQGRRLAQYDYRVPASTSAHKISLSEGSGTMGMKGSFWADPETFDIVRLSMESDGISAGLPVLTYATSIDYAHTNLNGSDFLLPQSADSRMVKFSGEDNRSHVEFTHCRLYAAQSSISFGTTQGFPQFGESSVLEVKSELLPALLVVVKLTTRITDKTAVGTLIEGVVAGNVMHRKHVLIPNGSPVRGRVRRLEWNDDKGGYYVVALEFTELEAAGTRYRFFADLEGTDGMPGLRQAIRTRKPPEKTLLRGGAEAIRSEEMLLLPDLPGVGNFFVQSRRLDLEPGFRMTWKTCALVP